MSTINPESPSSGNQSDCCACAFLFIAETIIENVDLKWFLAIFDQSLPKLTIMIVT